MTATSRRRSAARPRSRFVAIVVYTLQSCFPPKRWVGGAAAVRRRAAVRAARPRGPRRAARASVRQRRRRGHLRAGHADRRARHRRLRARRRGARRHVPLHLAVADADVADRARPLVRRLVRRARHDRAGRPRWPRSSPARRRAPAPAFVAAAVGSVAYVAVFIAIGVHHPAHRGVVAGVRVPRRAAARRRAHRHRPALADVGVAGDLRRPPRRSRRAASSATASPQGGARDRAAGDRDGRRARRRELADGATCAWPAPPTESVC